jgi:uncharacterized protein involved in exopolysaccharide biosynthesis
LLRHRRFLFWEVLIVTGVVIIFSLIAKPTFTSSAQILPPVEDESDLSSLSSMLSGGGLGNLARLGSGLRGTQSSDMIAAILNSRTIRERVIDSCDFMNVYKFQTSREAAVRALGDLTKVRVTDEGIIDLSVNAKSPSYAAKLATSYVNELDRFLRESNMSRGRSMRIFIGERIKQSQQDLADAEDSLTTFQKLNRVTAVDDETKAALDAYATLKAKKITSDIDLEFAQGLAGTDNPFVQNLHEQDEDLAHQLSDFEVGGKSGSDFGIGGSVPLKAVPEVAGEYMRLLANYKLQQELYGMLVAQYEQARITEVRDTPEITVLDPPTAPEQRSFPRRTRMTLSAFAVSLIAGLLISFLMEFWEKQKQDPSAWQEWRQIGQVLAAEARPVTRWFRRRRAK